MFEITPRESGVKHLIDIGRGSLKKEEPVEDGPSRPLPKASDLYPNGWRDWEGDVPWPGYTPILQSLGEIICRIDIPDIGGYNGDTQVLFREVKTGRYGYLMFGWGSCSGCDALLRCETYAEVDELIESTYNSIRWFDSIPEALKFFREHEWRHDHCHSKLFVDFCEKLFVQLGRGSIE